MATYSFRFFKSISIDSTLPYVEAPILDCSVTFLHRKHTQQQQQQQPPPKKKCGLSQKRIIFLCCIVFSIPKYKENGTSNHHHNSIVWNCIRWRRRWQFFFLSPSWHFWWLLFHCFAIGKSDNEHWKKSNWIVVSFHPHKQTQCKVHRYSRLSLLLLLLRCIQNASF